MNKEYIIIWEFMVEHTTFARFEAAYGPHGAWAQLFRREGSGEQYLGTLLLRDPDRPGRYVTIDRWRSGAAWRDFKRRVEREYESLDNLCAALTVEERLIGEFEVVR